MADWSDGDIMLRWFLGYLGALHLQNSFECRCHCGGRCVGERRCRLQPPAVPCLGCRGLRCDLNMAAIQTRRGWLDPVAILPNGKQYRSNLKILKPKRRHFCMCIDHFLFSLRPPLHSSQRRVRSEHCSSLPKVPGSAVCTTMKRLMNKFLEIFNLEGSKFENSVACFWSHNFIYGNEQSGMVLVL